MMNKFFNAAIASAALIAVTTIGGQASAGGPNGYYGSSWGSMKDGPVPQPQIVQPVRGAGGCYWRGDFGYGFNREPDTHFYSDMGTVVDGDLSDVSLDNNWLIETGLGCGIFEGLMGHAGSGMGLRGEVVVGYHSERELTGLPDATDTGYVVGANLSSYTLMANVYKDFGDMSGFTPYLGLGVGMAYHVMDDVTVTGEPTVGNFAFAGNSDLSFAWSIMAGVGIALRDNWMLDIGYRYMDLGRVTSQHHVVSSSTTAGDPVLKVDNLRSHEIKAGLRYNFGGIH